MKYLIQNRKECTMTIVALIVAILDFIKVFVGIDLGINEGQILAVVSAIMGILVWYYNMPTSKENSEATGEMRLRKKMNKILKNNKEFVGENFYDEVEEKEEE